MYTPFRRFCIPKPLCGEYFCSGQHSNKCYLVCSQARRPRGAVRFLFWWLFLHRRLRSGNEAQLSLNRFCSLRRVLASGCHSFLFEWLEKVSQPSLAEPFGSDKGVNRIDSRLSLLSLGRHRTDCRSLSRSRRPQPSRQGGLYS